MPPSGEWRQIYSFGCNQQDLCWFVSPGQLQDEELNSCGSPLCWLNLFGNTYYYAVGCDAEFCEYNPPDGDNSYRSYCEDDVCWSQPPEGGAWQDVGYNCDEEGFWCWYTPPDGGASVLEECDFSLCFATPPEGGIPFFYYGEEGAAAAAVAAALPVYCGLTNYCWAVPLDDPDVFIVYGVPCGYTDQLCWVTPPNGTATWPVDCGIEACWYPWPPDIGPPEDYGLPPDQLLLDECAPGETGEPGEPGTSVPLVVEEGVSSHAELAEGTVKDIAPEPSASTTPATFDPGTVTELPLDPSSDVIEAEIARPDIVDYDGDGCSNLRERSFSALTGGLRDPDNVWDFFDTPGTGNVRDGAITAADIARIVQRFGRNGSAAMDPLAPPPAPPAYHTAFDRMSNGDGPNGSITTQDIAVEVGQFGHTCL
jgi:hypothetical protein